jgi:dihydrofolate reductase
MAGKVFFSVTMSLDGFMAPEAVPAEDVFSPEKQDDPGVRRWMTKWSELQAWLFPQRWFRENLKLGEGGEEGIDNDIARATYERTGASVMGKRMFDLGEQAWPEEAPFHTPVFVVTHTRRDPWERPGGTTFHFVNDGIESALDQAREAAGDRDVRSQAIAIWNVHCNYHRPHSAAGGQPPASRLKTRVTNVRPSYRF